ncbi:hypothetical protein [Haliangium sp.]|uniref:hypothetical protein n=1 Tax=Haliangium sp. TaxID=2663208 RepID=UPI003D1309B5
MSARAPRRTRLCRRVGLALVTLALAVAGCQSKSDDRAKPTAQTGTAVAEAPTVTASAAEAASCKAVGAHLRTLARRQVATLDEKQRSVLDHTSGQLEEVYVKQCRERAWPAAARRCMVEATTAEGFDDCARALANRLSRDR